MHARPAVLIGIGNSDRADDAAGLEVVRAMRPHVDPEIPVRECGGDLTELLELWEGKGLAVVVDAVRSGHPPGTILRYEVGPSGTPPTIPPASTHTFSLAEAIGLSTILDRRPSRWVVYGIEAGDVGVGRPMTASVAAAVPVVATRALVELASAPAEETSDA